MVNQPVYDVSIYRRIILVEYIKTGPRCAGILKLKSWYVEITGKKHWRFWPGLNQKAL